MAGYTRHCAFVVGHITQDLLAKADAPQIDAVAHGM